MKKKRPMPKAPPTYSVEALLAVAHDFDVGAAALHGHVEDALKNGDNNKVAPGSFVILATLHVELLLKALHVLNSRGVKGHNLVELFDELPKIDRDAIRALYDAKPSNGNKLSLQDALQQFKTAFVDWRYAYELPTSKLSVPTLSDLTRAIELRVKVLRGVQ